MIKKIKRLLTLRRIKKTNRALKHIMLGDCSISHIENLNIKDGCRIESDCRFVSALNGILEVGNKTLVTVGAIINEEEILL